MSTITLAITAAGFRVSQFTGTFATAGTTAVVGDGTEFSSRLVGKKFRFVGGSTDYTIASVTDSTHLTTTEAVPAGTNQVAILAEEEDLLLDNFRLLGSASLANANAFEAAGAVGTHAALTTGVHGLGNKADLVNGLVPASQLPSYVDDVIEAATATGFPTTGESGKIYVALDSNLTYRWSGSAYVEISQSLALGETSSTAYRGDRGAAAYAAMHSQGSDSSVHPTLDGFLFAVEGVLHDVADSGSGSVVRQISPTLLTPTIASLIGNKIYPAVDGTTAIQINKADGSTNVVTIDTTNGYVGFGAAPICRLDLGGALTTNAQIKVGSLHFQGYAINNSAITDNLYWNTAWKYRDSGYGIALSLVNGAFTIRTAPSGTAGGTATVTDRFTIANNGNVGIGLTAPNARLEVLSTTEQLRLSYDSTYYTKFTQSTTGLTFAPAVNSTTAFKFNKADGTTNVVTIDTTNGYVSIGTTTTTRPLYVNGVIESNNLIKGVQFAATSDGTSTSVFYDTAITAPTSGSGYAKYLHGGTLFTDTEVARYLGFNSAASWTGRFIELAKNNVLKFSVDESGNMTSGVVTASQFRLSALNTAPPSASDTGTLGEIRVVDGYIYVCTATNTWKRVAIATW